MRLGLVPNHFLTRCMQLDSNCSFAHAKFLFTFINFRTIIGSQQKKTCSSGDVTCQERGQAYYNRKSNILCTFISYPFTINVYSTVLYNNKSFKLVSIELMHALNQTTI